jgi:hypothetical protein
MQSMHGGTPMFMAPEIITGEDCDYDTTSPLTSLPLELLCSSSSQNSNPTQHLAIPWP